MPSQSNVSTTPNQTNNTAGLINSNSNSNGLASSTGSKYLNQVEIDTMVRSIFGARVPDELRKIGEDKHPRTGVSNYEEHKEQIYRLIDSLYGLAVEKGRSKTSLLSCLKFGDANTIDINVYVHKNDKGEVNFYFVGRDLVNYLTSLPKFAIVQNGKREYISSTKGSNHSRWYIHRVKPFIVQIAINLRLLELYLRSQKRNNHMVLQNSNILGLNIPIDIPEKYTTHEFVSDNGITREHEIKSIYNPRLIGPGLFAFGKNGVNSTITNNMINVANQTCPNVSKNMYPRMIRSKDLHNFYNSDYKIAICAFGDRHARLIVKVLNPESDELNNSMGEASAMRVDLDNKDDIGAYGVGKIDLDDSDSDDSDFVNLDNLDSEEVNSDKVDSEEVDSEEVDYWNIREQQFGMGVSVRESGGVSVGMSANTENNVKIGGSNGCVKDVDYTKYDIWIVDPWKKYIAKDIMDELNRTNPEFTIKFISRSLKDQDKEGSCVLCSFARILHILDFVNFDSTPFDQRHQLLSLITSCPIPDFYAYLTSYILRTRNRIH